MKRIKYLTVIIAVLMTASACNELLDQMPSNRISGLSMWTTEEQADMGVKGAYAALQRPLQGSGIVGEGVDIGYYGFDVLGMAGQGSYAVSNLFTSGVNPINERFSFTWRWCYTGIHRVNNAIYYIPDIPMNERKRARLIAECKVLRAIFYMRLNELYGNNGEGVPLYLEPISPAECDRAQDPEADVWAQVIKDLTEAIEEPELPDNQIMGEGRASKGAAYAFRGRVYLIIKDYDRAIADFVKVGDCGYKLYPDYKKLFKVEQERCEEMIFSVQYIEDPTGYGNRVQKYCAAFQQGSRDSRGCWTDLQVSPGIVNLYEVLVDANTVKPFNWSDFIPEWTTVANEADRKVFFIRDQFVNGEDIHSTVTSQITSQLNSITVPEVRDYYLQEGNEARVLEAYANRDPRLAYNVITPYSNFLGVNSNSTDEGWYTSRWPATNNGKYYFDQPQAEPFLRDDLPDDYYPTGTANAQANFYYMHRKFVGEGLEFLRREQNPIDEPIIRYADILLMWAEALVEKNSLNEAMAKVKEVRDRVGIPTMASSFANQTEARNYVRDERRRELMGEGINFFDEMRWRTLKETKFDTEYPQGVWGGRTGGTLYQWIGDHFYTWPVPRAEVELNPNLKRTPGWIY